MRERKLFLVIARQLLNVGVTELEIHDLITTKQRQFRQETAREKATQAGPGGIRNENLQCFKAPPVKHLLNAEERKYHFNWRNLQAPGSKCCF